MITIKNKLNSAISIVVWCAMKAKTKARALTVLVLMSIGTVNITNVNAQNIDFYNIPNSQNILTNPTEARIDEKGKLAFYNDKFEGVSASVYNKEGKLIGEVFIPPTTSQTLGKVKDVLFNPISEGGDALASIGKFTPITATNIKTSIAANDLPPGSSIVYRLGTPKANALTQIGIITKFLDANLDAMALKYSPAASGLTASIKEVFGESLKDIELINKLAAISLKSDISAGQQIDLAMEAVGDTVKKNALKQATQQSFSADKISGLVSGVWMNVKLVMLAEKYGGTASAFSAYAARHSSGALIEGVDLVKIEGKLAPAYQYPHNDKMVLMETSYEKGILWGENLVVAVSVSEKSPVVSKNTNQKEQQPSNNHPVQSPPVQWATVTMQNQLSAITNGSASHIGSASLYAGVNNHQPIDPALNC